MALARRVLVVQFVSAVPSPRPHRLGILFLILTLTVLALEVWAIGSSLTSFF